MFTKLKTYLDDIGEKRLVYAVSKATAAARASQKAAQAARKSAIKSGKTGAAVSAAAKAAGQASLKASTGSTKIKVGSGGSSSSSTRRDQGDRSDVSRGEAMENLEKAGVSSIMEDQGVTRPEAQRQYQSSITKSSSSTPQSAAGIQTESNAYGTQMTGVGTQMGDSPYTLPGGGADEYGLGGDYQPALDAYNRAQGTLAEEGAVTAEEAGLSFERTLAGYEDTIKQAESGLQYDPKTGTFTGLTADERFRQVGTLENQLADQDIQRANTLTDFAFAKSQSLGEIAKAIGETATQTEEQLLVSRTFAGLSGAFGSSAVFNNLQKVEREGLQEVNRLRGEAANATRFYADKAAILEMAYSRNVADLSKQIQMTLNDRYGELVSTINIARRDRGISEQEKSVAIRKAQLDYRKEADVMMTNAMGVITDYNIALRGAREKTAAEDLALRDEIGSGILNTYDALMPGFVPSPGKVQEFTNTIYEGLKLYKETGGREGYPNLQAGLADLMSAMQTSSYFSKFNAPTLPGYGKKTSSGPKPLGTVGGLSGTNILTAQAAGVDITDPNRVLTENDAQLIKSYDAKSSLYKTILGSKAGPIEDTGL